MLEVLQICAGASLGALCRWVATTALNPLFDGVYLGTLLVNWSGCLLMGIIVGIFNAWPQTAAWLRLPLVVGFLGAYTTLSAFAGELAGMVMGGRYIYCLVYSVMQVAGSILLVFVGIRLSLAAARLLSGMGG